MPGGKPAGEKQSHRFGARWRILLFLRWSRGVGHERILRRWREHRRNLWLIKTRFRGFRVGKLCRGDGRETAGEKGVVHDLRLGPSDGWPHPHEERGWSSGGSQVSAAGLRRTKSCHARLTAIMKPIPLLLRGGRRSPLTRTATPVQLQLVPRGVTSLWGDFLENGADLRGD